MSRTPLNRLFLAGVSSLLLFLQVVGLWYVFHWASTHAAVITPADIMFTLSAAIVPALLLAVCVGVLIAGMSPPPATQADEHQGAALANRLSYYEDLVRLMTQHQPGRMSLVDAEGRFHFVSAETAKILQRDANDLVGRDVEKVFGPREGLKLKMQMDQVRMTGKPLEQIEHGRGQQSGLFIRTQLIPITVAGQLSGGVMIYQDDVTSLMVAQERRERMFRQLMDTLVAVVDRRDPYAAGHSARVGQIARAIAEEMDLSENDVETVEIAGTLMNFGKVLVPRAILTKTSPLAPDELRQVRESIMTSADILALIGFELPVVPTLRQVLERFDGTGQPEGRRGDDIMQTARVVAVANAFVAIVSPRAHRPGVSVKQAVDALNQEAGKGFDGRVVIALANYVENRRDKPEWLALTA